MDWNVTLLRKVEVDPEARWGVAPGCLKTMRKCFWSSRDEDDTAVRGVVLEHVQAAAVNGHVFENPKRSTQLVAYAEIDERGCWFIIEHARSPEMDMVVLTVRMHRDRDFGDELSAMEEE